MFDGYSKDCQKAACRVAMAKKNTKKNKSVAVRFNGGEILSALCFSHFKIYKATEDHVGALFWWTCPLTDMSNTVANVSFNKGNLHSSLQSFKDYIGRVVDELDSLPEMDTHPPRLDFQPPTSMDMIGFATYQGTGEISMANFGYKVFLEATREDEEESDVFGSGLTLLRAEPKVHYSFVDNLIQFVEANA